MNILFAHVFIAFFLKWNTWILYVFMLPVTQMFLVYPRFSCFELFRREKLNNWICVSYLGQIVWNSLNSPGNFQIHGDLPASISYVLGLYVRATYIYLGFLLYLFSDNLKNGCKKQLHTINLVSHLGRSNMNLNRAVINTFSSVPGANGFDDFLYYVVIWSTVTGLVEWLYELVSLWCHLY